MESIDAKKNELAEKKKSIAEQIQKLKEQKAKNEL
jgi:hypothetical protein